jgi:protein ImuB
VMVHAGRPVRVTTGRRGLDGGAVASATGPWRTSGEWWHIKGEGSGRDEGRTGNWSRDEWDVALADGGIYRIYRDRSRDHWFVDGVVD